MKPADAITAAAISCVRRIAIVLHARDAGGAEGIAIRLARHWQEQGHDVRLFTIATAHNPLPLSADILEVCLDHPSDETHAIGRLFRLARTRKALHAALKTYAPDVVVSHGDRTNVLALLAIWGLAMKTIVTEHNHPILHNIGGFWQRLRGITYRHATQIIGVSAGIVAAMPPEWQAKARVIHNPVPALERPEHLVVQPQHIVAMGRLVAQKGFDLLISAFTEVKARHLQAMLTIYGDGPERGALTAQIRASQLEDAVALPGRVAGVEAALCAGAIFAFPSRYEGFGLALGEAMSLGLAVIAADCPSGPGEMITHGENGLLVPVNDAAALATGLITLLDDAAYAAQLGEAAREISTRFSEAKFLTAWDDAISP